MHKLVCLYKKLKFVIVCSSATKDIHKPIHYISLGLQQFFGHYMYFYGLFFNSHIYFRTYCPYFLSCLFYFYCGLQAVNSPHLFLNLYLLLSLIFLNLCLFLFLFHIYHIHIFLQLLHLSFYIRIFHNIVLSRLHSLPYILAPF